MNLYNEDKLFAQIKKKNKDAFVKAYDLYIDDIYRFIYFRTGNEEEAKDITSNVFLKTWNYIQEKNIDEAKSLRALIYKVARNSVIDFYRQSQEKEIRIDDNFDIADDKQNIIRHIEINFDFETIKNNLLKIKSKYREVIIMRFVDELSFKEIAQVIGKNEGNVRVLIHRALEALREILKQKN